MCEIASAIQHDDEYRPKPEIPSLHDMADVGAASWGEASAIISKYLEEREVRVD